MTNKEFAKELEERTVKFSVAVIKLSFSLSKQPEAMVLRNQLTKSATSVGANYREANRSRSQKDFKNRIRICESEASETEYWLIILERLNWVELNKIEIIKKEAKELLAIFTAIANKL